MNLKLILEAILGIGQEIIPMFIHNPTSQKIEGVIFTTLNGAVQAVTSATTKPPAAQ